jgi:hypothetical protein
MKSRNGDKKSKAFPQKSEKRSPVIEEFIKDFRNNKMAAIANLDEERQTIIANWAQDLVDLYGSLLQDYSAKIKDAADLPCQREDLKIAIKVLLPAYLAKGSDDTVDLLKDRYIRLSAFQAISREDKSKINKKSNDSDQESEPADSSLFSAYQKYMQIIISEQNVFLEEINTFINDLKARNKDL